MQKKILSCLLLSLFVCLSMPGQEVCTDVATARLVDVSKLDRSLSIDLRYATANNFTGRQIYPLACCLLVEPAALALVRVNASLRQQGLVLKIWDAYRPHSYQKILWQIVPDDRYVADPRKGSRHNRGCAVDVTLCELATGKELQMPTPFDDFSPQAHRQATGGSPQARHNSEVLENAMAEQGFVGLLDEWWHFDYQGWRQHPLLDIPFTAFTE